MRQTVVEYSRYPIPTLSHRGNNMLYPFRNLTPKEFLKMNEHNLHHEVVLILRELIKENEKLKTIVNELTEEF